MLHVCNITRFPPCCCIGQMLNFTENATCFLYKSHRSCQKHSNFGRETYEIFRKPLGLTNDQILRWSQCFLGKNEYYGIVSCLVTQASEPLPLQVESYTRGPLYSPSHQTYDRYVARLGKQKSRVVNE